MSDLLLMVGRSTNHNLIATYASTLVLFSLGRWCCTLTVALHMLHNNWSLWNIWMRSFEIYGKWSVQTSIDTHTHAQWGHASMGLTQARPNHWITKQCITVWGPSLSKHNKHIYTVYTMQSYWCGARSGSSQWVTIWSMTLWSGVHTDTRCSDVP